MEDVEAVAVVVGMFWVWVGASDVVKTLVDPDISVVLKGWVSSGADPDSEPLLSTSSLVRLAELTATSAIKNRRES